MKKQLSWIGIAIIGLAFLFATNPFGILPAIPMYVIGVALIWFGHFKALKKTLITILPLILVYPFALLLIQIFGVSPQHIELRFPENFNNQISIIYPIPCGQEVQFEDGREIIYVPKSGIILYQGEIEPYMADWTGVLNPSHSIHDFKLWHLDFPKSEMHDTPNDSLGIFIDNSPPFGFDEPDFLNKYKSTFLNVSTWGDRDKERPFRIAEEVQLEIDNCN